MRKTLPTFRPAPPLQPAREPDVLLQALLRSLRILAVITFDAVRKALRSVDGSGTKSIRRRTNRWMRSSDTI